jgi:hypothetical protein
VSTAADGKPEGERARWLAPPDLVLSVALYVVAVVLEAKAFLGNDPWIGADLVGAGFLLVFVAGVVARQGDGRADRSAGSGWIRGVVALLAGMTLLVVRPAPIPPPVVQGLAVAGAAFSVFEGLLKAGTHRR